jgi:hypothetical protein
MITIGRSLVSSGILRRCVGLALALALAASAPAFAAGLNALQATILVNSRSANDSDGYPVVSFVCSTKNDIQVTAAAKADGIQSPKDFLVALRAFWCAPDRGTPSASTQVIPRVALPFTATTGNGQVRILRSGVDLSRWLKDVGYVGELPYEFVVKVSHAGRRVAVESTREGGGDAYTFVLRDGRWQLRQFVHGGGC